MVTGFDMQNIMSRVYGFDGPAFEEPGDRRPAQGWSVLRRLRALIWGVGAA